MPGYSLRPPLLRIFFFALTLMAPRLVAAQASGPQSVRVPPPVAKAGAAKSKTDRSSLPPIPTFKDVAKDVGLTAVHTAAGRVDDVVRLGSSDMDGGEADVFGDVFEGGDGREATAPAATLSSPSITK